MSNKLTEIAKRLKAMAETGLLFTKEAYDLERYEELQDLSHQIMAMESGSDSSGIKNYFAETTDYPTPKVDVRGFLLNDKNEILMVQEKCDNKWTIPGGWCEIGYSPKENIIKEMQEESGLDIEVDRLLAVFDKRCHSHPPRPHYVYKLVYWCKSLSFELNPNHEITDAKFFPISNLPELSEDRIVTTQLELLYKKVIQNDFDVHSD